MKPIYVILGTTLMLSLFCEAEITRLPLDQRKLLQEMATVRLIRSTKALPAQIVACCADSEGKLADPGQQWEPTDVRHGKKLPTKRLIWASKLNNNYVVHYEIGGIGHSFHVLLATWEEGQKNANIVWSGVGNQLKDFRCFLNALQKDKLDDRYDYAH